MKKLKNLNYTYIIVALIIGLSILGYGYLSYQKQKMVLGEKRMVETEEKAKKAKEDSMRTKKLETCLTNADSRSSEWWLSNCENHGFNIEKDEDGEITTCSLYSDLGSQIQEGLQKDKDRCAKLYGN